MSVFGWVIVLFFATVGGLALGWPGALIALGLVSGFVVGLHRSSPCGFSQRS